MKTESEYWAEAGWAIALLSCGIGLGMTIAQGWCW